LHKRKKWTQQVYTRIRVQSLAIMWQQFPTKSRWYLPKENLHPNLNDPLLQSQLILIHLEHAYLSGVWLSVDLNNDPYKKRKKEKRTC
jgi:hypothetical protein